MERPEKVEISATSVEDAIQLALEQLGRSRDEVDIKVLRYPNEPDEHGFITDEALVSVSVKSRSSELPEDQEAEKIKHLLTPDEREAVANLGQEVMSDILHHLNLVASCKINQRSLRPDQAESPVVLEVEGEDLGILIGRKGDNLDDVQFVLNHIVQKKVGYWPNILLDVAGYRRRREAALREMAKRAAARVVRTRQPYSFEPMPPRERRIIHLTLSRDNRVRSESSGEGDERHVVVYPNPRRPNVSNRRKS